MALTPAGKGIIVAVLIGAIGYGVVQYRNTIQPESIKSSTDSTVQFKDNVVLDTLSNSHIKNQEVQKEITNSNELDRTPVKLKEPIIEKHISHKSAPKKKVIHSEKKTSPEPTSSNNVIPNF